MIARITRKTNECIAKANNMIRPNTVMFFFLYIYVYVYLISPHLFLHRFGEMRVSACCVGLFLLFLALYTLHFFGGGGEMLVT